MGEVILGIVSAGAVLAAWDAMRRYIAGQQLAQREIDRIIALEYEQKKTRELVDNLGSKLNAAQAANANRTPRIGGLR